MPTLDAMLDNPALTAKGFLQECLTSCITCQTGLSKMGVNLALAEEREDTWTLLCATHSPWIRAKVDTTFLPSVRSEVEMIEKFLTGCLDLVTINQYMDNGYDMFSREVITEGRYQTRMAELEHLRDKRIEVEADLTYWQLQLTRATADAFIDSE
jgi:hypothetical protein